MLFLQRCWSFCRRLFQSLNPRPPQKMNLRLESLEDRMTPAVSSNDLFVSTLYQGVLGRTADATALTYWGRFLNSGTINSNAVVATSITGSDEALSRDIQIFYQAILSRTANAPEVAFWFGQLKSGATLDQVKAGILGSNEFFTLVGGTNQNFLDAVYRRELGRVIDPAGQDFWSNLLNLGRTRTYVAQKILASPEASNEKVASFYTAVLARAPDAAGMIFWPGLLQNGIPETNVLAGLLGSTEFVNNIQSVAAGSTLTDPNSLANLHISAAGLFPGPLPNAEYLAHTISTFRLVPGFQPFQTIVSTTDIYAPNQTSDKAHDFGSQPLLNIFSYQNLNITAGPSGQYEWFRWEASAAGTFNATLTTTSGGPLEMHLFTLNGNTLNEVNNTTSGTLPTRLSQGQTVFVEVKGQNTAPGVQSTGTYNLDVALNS
jgi:hypothetical protein